MGGYVPVTMMLLPERLTVVPLREPMAAFSCSAKELNCSSKDVGPHAAGGPPRFTWVNDIVVVDLLSDRRRQNLGIKG